MDGHSKERARPRRVKLTKDFVKNVAVVPGQTRTTYVDEALRGFALEVTKDGSKSFVLSYRVGRGRRAPRRQMKIADAVTIDPAKAREQAKRVLAQVMGGRDPLQEQRRELAKEDSTLKAVCEDYLKREGSMTRHDDGSVTFKDDRKLRSAPERLAVFERHVYPSEIAGVQIEQIKRSGIVSLLDKIEDERGPQAAHQVLALLSRVFSWYAARNDDFRSPVVRGMGRVKPKERARKRILTDEEIRDVWSGLDTAEDIPACYPPFVRSLLFTALRRSESACAAWPEIKYLRRDGFAGEAWTIPGSRMKGKLDHVIPLTRTMIEIVGNRPNDAHRRPFVFSTTGGAKPFSGFSKAKKALDKAIDDLRKKDGREPMPQWQLHDLRRTAKTLMARAGVRPDISERVLAHVIPGVEGTYDRYEYLAEKHDALERLAALIDRILHPVDNVASLDERRAAAG